VFDIDVALFERLWATTNRGGVHGYMRFYISDHRLLWAEFDVG
jgi:hypothetical protein